ncbi:ankyrin repeat and sterile alpha motif domain-containing protein 1B isoform X3 [Stomoxys calcitrans]|uniref:ankyrin repeat and sterile alpha motif domain-containing protein 1B isoform X3 n=1 Tax=Stomoxys calcitrans TaxID=35570 RepID=UPI0027E237B2|nr:ankyrin repeat and sterile alpha motif domain-containing protein 1B isoform X3 [Stomoxys calcitrans]
MGKCHDLLDAARSGNISAVGKLLEQCAKKGGPLSSFRRSPSINGQDMNGYTPLHHACLNGHVEIVRLLLANDAMTDVPDIRGSTPLYLASWAGHQEIVKMLLMHNMRPANPNAQTSENETALHCAAQHGHNAAVAILLAYGADPTIRNNSFQTALDLASQFGRLQVVQILIRTHPELIEPFRVYDEMQAYENGHSPPYTITPTKHIYTHSCLHLAARNGHKKVVETLLAAGVDVNILTNAGSALHEAALCGKKSVVCALLRSGIDPYAVDGNGRTALDLLKDYPPHVTYEIVTIINDFCRDSSKMENQTHFMTIKDVNDNTTITNNDDYDLSQDKHNKTSESHSFEKQIPLTTNSLIRQISTDRYTPMEPIFYPKGNSNRSTPENILEYKPVYTPKLLHRRLGVGGGKTVDKIFPILHSKIVQTSTPQYHCVDEYVEMSLPSANASNSPRTPLVTSPLWHQLEVKKQQPLPSPRETTKYGDYANINTIVTNGQKNKHLFSQNAVNDDDNGNKMTTTPRPGSFGDNCNNNNNTNNNNRRQSSERSIHSPTPDCPPPSALQAETTIFEFVKPPPDKSLKRKSLNLQQQQRQFNPQFYSSLKSFIWEEEMEPPEEEQFDSLSSSRVSECVEEFVGDVPFAGLFKGSSLNLAAASNEQDLGKNPAIEEPPSGLRSPSLVKSVKPMPAKRTVKIANSNGKNCENASKESEVLMVGAKQTTENEFDFDATKVWEEINTIFESIGNEVSTGNDSTLEATIKDESKYTLSDTLRKKTLTIRKPADLLLRSPTPPTAENPPNLNPNWCHSANTLIYGYVLYEVFYLGSTVIRELHGTVSTRKSIQKLKREETPAPIEYNTENGLIDDINCSTKILKETNQQTRLQVGIALSHTGVRFIDIDNKSTISVHDIENINCVSQDNDDLRYFAYITREKDTHYCHVFMVDSLELATEIILTLGQAFEVAYQLSLMNQEETRAMNTEQIKRLSYCDIVDNI